MPGGRPTKYPKGRALRALEDRIHGLAREGASMDLRRSAVLARQSWWLDPVRQASRPARDPRSPKRRPVRADDAAGAPIVSRICALWLDGTPTELGDQRMPLRDTLARLAIETARTEEIANIVHGWFGGKGEPGKSIFKAALGAAADLPEETGTFALEMSRRRPLAASSQMRVNELRAAERAHREAAAKAQESQPPLKELSELRSDRSRRSVTLTASGSAFHGIIRWRWKQA